MRLSINRSRKPSPRENVVYLDTMLWIQFNNENAHSKDRIAGIRCILWFVFELKIANNRQSICGVQESTLWIARTGSRK